MDTAKYILFYVVCGCLVSIPLLDSMLFRLIWKENPDWAKTVSMPRNVWERGGKNLLRWRYSVMSFDLNLRITQSTCYLAVFAGIVYNIGLVSLLLLILAEACG